MTTININGKVYTCTGDNNVIISKNNEVIVNGKVISGSNQGKLNVSIDGNINSIDCNGSVKVNGNVNKIQCSGSCTVSGDVQNDIAAGGSVTCQKVYGSIQAGGSVHVM